MTIHSIREVIDKLPFAHCQDDFDQLQQLRAIIVTVMHQHQLDDKSIVVNSYTNDRLHIQVDSTTMAACLRQILPTLQSTLNQARFPITDINISSLYR